MIIKHISILLACFLYTIRPAFSQDCIHGQVKENGGFPVPFALVSDLSGRGVMCDSAGHFRFCYTVQSPGKLVIGAVGFTTDTIMLIAAKPETEIVLQRNEIKLDEIMVVHQQSIRDRSMVSTIVTGKKEIEKMNPSNVSEVLQTKMGFTNRSDYQAPLTLRGMSGKRLLVLRNGMRRFSSYPAGYMTHTINVYDLERIEVEKGAASVIYGAGAMAGIVNLIDRSPFKQEGFNAKLTAGYGSVNNENNILACGGWSNGKIAVKAGMRYRSAGNFRYPGGKVAENSFYTDKDLFVSAGYQFNEKQELVITSDIHYGGPWGKPVGFNGSDYMRVQTRNEDTYNVALQYSIRNKGVLNLLELNAFYSDEKRKHVKRFYTAAGYRLSYIETTRFSDYYYGTHIRGKLQLSSENTLTLGAEFYSFHISTPTDAVDYIEGISFNNRVSKNARSYVTGTYLEYTYMPGRHLKLVTGLRYDYASVYEGEVHNLSREDELNTKKDAVSGNLAVLYALGRTSKIRINMARSFRMPETTELYADSYTMNGIVYANPDLDPEYCYSIDLCYSFTSGLMELEISPFVWFINNMITREEIKGMPGTNYQYINVGRSRIFGGEAVVEIPIKSIVTPNDRVSVSLGLALLNGTDVSTSNDFLGSGVPLDYVPPFNLKAGISYNNAPGSKIEYSLDLRTVYYSEQTRLGESHYATPAYFLLGCSAGATFPAIKTRPSINLAVNNLFNARYYNYLSYLPSEGRDIRIFLTFHFD